MPLSFILALQSLGFGPGSRPEWQSRSDITNYLPNTGVPGTGIAAGIAQGQQLFSFATYNRANKLPYTINDTLDLQWQPRNDRDRDRLCRELRPTRSHSYPLQSSCCCLADKSCPRRYSFRAGLHLRIYRADSFGLLSFLQSICPTASPCSSTTRGETWICVFPTLVTRRNRRPTRPPESLPTTRSRLTSKNA